MDQTTHERRFADWQAIITNCLSRPTGQSKRECLLNMMYLKSHTIIGSANFVGRSVVIDSLNPLL